MLTQTKPHTIVKALPRRDNRTVGAPRWARSVALVAFGCFLFLNLLAPLLEPGAYYACARKQLDFSEKIGLYLVSKPKPGVLFMGSSRPCLGFNTTVAQDMLTHEHLADRIMNLCVVATTFDFNNILLKNWILPNKAPKVIVYGLSEFDLFGNDDGKSRYRSLWRGIPYAHTLSRWDDWQQYADAEFPDKIEFVIDQLFPMVRSRKLLRDAFAVICHTSPQALSKHPRDYIEGVANEFTDEQVKKGDANYITCLPLYDMSKPNFLDIERFVQMTKAHHIKLIFVVMPVTDRFRAYWKDPEGSKIRKWRETIDTFALQRGVPIYDYYNPPADLLNPKTAFRDSNHLCGAGARLLTKRIMSQAVIPQLQNQ